MLYAHFVIRLLEETSLVYCHVFEHVGQEMEISFEHVMLQSADQLDEQHGQKICCDELYTAFQLSFFCHVLPKSLNGELQIASGGFLKDKCTKEPHNSKKLLNIRLGPKLSHKLRDIKKVIKHHLNILICIEIEQGNTKHFLIEVILRHFVLFYCINNTRYHCCVILVHLVFVVYLVLFLYVL